MLHVACIVNYRKYQITSVEYIYICIYFGKFNFVCLVTSVCIGPPIALSFPCLAVGPTASVSPLTRHRIASPPDRRTGSFPTHFQLNLDCGSARKSLSAWFQGARVRDRKDLTRYFMFQYRLEQVHPSE